MQPAGDIILAIVSDEENGGNYGAKFLAEKHPELFEGVRYSIGEAGGFTLYLGGQKFYPIQIAEKQRCTMQATLRGPGGHGSTPIKGGAMAKLGRSVDQARYPAVAGAYYSGDREDGNRDGPPSARRNERNAPTPARPANNRRHAGMLGPFSRNFVPLFHNTVSPTIVSGGFAHNVSPARSSSRWMGAFCPASPPTICSPSLAALPGRRCRSYNWSATTPIPATSPWDSMIRWPKSCGKPTRRACRSPICCQGVTDGRHFARLGIENYGFSPMTLPEGFTFSTVHAADERVPAEALEFGTSAIYRLLERYGG